jgi:hypothetical protein
MWRSRYPESSDPAVQAAQREAAGARAGVGVVVVLAVLALGVLTLPASEMPSSDTPVQAADTVSAAPPA